MFWTEREMLFWKQLTKQPFSASCKHERVGKEFLLSLDGNKQKGKQLKDPVSCNYNAENQAENFIFWCGLFYLNACKTGI